MRLISVELQGFLTYRDAASFDFTEGSLWLLTGNNGVGKSAIFDAITMALYGTHRSGGEPNVTVINDDSDAASVAVVLDLGGRVFRIGRVLKRVTKGKKGTPGAKESVSTEGIVERLRGRVWEPVEGTRKISGLTQWVAENLRLSSDAFTACVVLLQKQAGRFMGASPAERLNLLLSLIDFKPYEMIAQRHDEGRRAADSRVKVLSAQLNGYSPVTDEMLADAAASAAAAATALERQGALLTDQERVASEYARAEEVSARLRTISEELTNSRRLLQSRDAVLAARDVAVRSAAAYPSLRQVYAGQREEASARAEAESLGRERADLLLIFEEAKASTQRQRLEVEAATAARDAAASATREGERAVDAAQAALTEASRLVAVTQQIGTLETSLARALALVADAPAVTAAGERLTVLTRAADIVKRLIPLIPAHAAAQTAREAAAHVLREALASLDAARARARSLDAESERRRTELTDAQAALHEARVHVHGLRERVEARALAHAAEQCPTCATTLDEAAHVRLGDELGRLASEVERAQLAVVTAEGRQAAALGALRAHEAEVVAAHALTAACESAVATAQSESSARAATCSALEASVAGTEAELRTALSLGADAPLPSLDELRREAGGVVPVAKRAEAIQLAQREVASIDGQLTALRSTPGVADATVRLEAAHVALTAAREAAAAQRAAFLLAETALRSATAQLDAVQQRLATVQERGADIRARLDSATRRADEAAQRVAAAREQLDAQWHTWIAEHTEDALLLVKEEADQELMLRAQASAAERAEARMAALSEESTGLTRIQATLPALAGVDVAELMASARDARAAYDAASAESQRAQWNLARLSQTLEATAALRAELAEADSLAALHSQLATRLGRQGLQARLIQQVQAEIIEEANITLARISDDSLVLTLDVARNPDELQIFIREVGRSERLRVFQALSGGQQFRVAVAMAMGIGQYLMKRSGSNRIETLMIDEGFGELDEMGLDEMLAELQILSSVLSCVIVVSHQKNVWDTFPDRFNIASRAGTSVATRFSGGRPYPATLAEPLPAAPTVAEQGVLVE